MTNHGAGDGPGGGGGRMLGNTTERWGSLQIGLHWTVAALILIQVPAGWGDRKSVV